VIHPKSVLSIILAAVCLLAAGTASAVLRKGDLGLTHGGTTCDGKGTFGYTATWRSASSASAFQVNTGNQCTINGTICGVSTKGCSVSCVKGTCSAKLALCTVGKGAPWIKATALDGTVYQQVAAPAPSMCP